MRTTRKVSRSRNVKALGVVASAALVLAACGGGGGSADEATAAPAAKAPAASHRSRTPSSRRSTPTTATPRENNATKNNLVLQRVLTGFWFFGDDGEIDAQPRLRHVQEDLRRPADGRVLHQRQGRVVRRLPIDCDDILLFWAANSGKIGEGLFSASGTTGVELIEVPDCDAGDKNFTFNYSEPFADWEGQGAPAPPTSCPRRWSRSRADSREQEFIDAVKKPATPRRSPRPRSSTTPAGSWSRAPCPTPR